MKAFYWTILLFGLLIAACKPEFDIDGYLDERVQTKTKTYLKKEREKCKVKASEDAETHIDSLINQWISKDLLDTVTFPTKPVKPGKPGHIINQWVDPKDKQGSNQ